VASSTSPAAAPAPESAPGIASDTPAAGSTDQAAAPPVAAPPAAAAAEQEGYKDGTYVGWGTSRHGDIQAAVLIQNGRITGARIARCLTRYSCDIIDHLPGQVIKRQDADVDNVGGATESADAFYWAITDALSKAL
jgi:uncharacterized protein with FMN-binding domain